MSGVFVEDPWSRIVDVHWKKKSGSPPDFVPSPSYCGHYGFGSIMTNTGTVITGRPFGSNQFAPFVGSYFLNKMNTSDELFTGALTGPPVGTGPDTVESAAPNGLHANLVMLGPGFLLFTNTQIQAYQAFPGGPIGTLNWAVPTAQGQETEGVFTVIGSYDIDVQYERPSGFGGGDQFQFGIGISHPLPGGALVGPPEPVVVVGNGDAGAGSFSYDFKYADYAADNIHFDAGNQFDPSTGGPAYLWWMRRRNLGSGFGAWSSSSQFMANILLGVGDFYLWDIVANCTTYTAPEA